MTSAVCTRALFIALVVASSVRLLAQSSEPDPHEVQPQRPSVATHAWTAAPGWLEVEAGTEFDRFDDGSHGGLIPINVKIGLAPRVQLEAIASMVQAPGPPGAAFGDLALGVKWRFVERKPIVGSLAVFSTLKMPTGSTRLDAGTGTTDVSVVVISSHRFGDVSLDLNAGFTGRIGDDTYASRKAGVWAMAFGGPAAGPVGWVAELFGFPRTSGPAGDKAVVAALFGPTFSARSWLAFDVGVIAPITGPQPRAIYAGVVYNIGQLWR
jgi:hypothetical protein